MGGSCSSEKSIFAFSGFRERYYFVLLFFGKKKLFLRAHFFFPPPGGGAAANKMQKGPSAAERKISQNLLFFSISP